MRHVDPPPGIRRDLQAWSWSVAWSYEGAITTWRLDSDDGVVRFLKVRALEEVPRLGAEAVRLRWARQHLAVPEVVAFGTDDDVDWLLLEALPGRDAMARAGAGARPPPIPRRTCLQLPVPTVGRLRAVLGTLELPRTA